MARRSEVASLAHRLLDIGLGVGVGALLALGWRQRRVVAALRLREALLTAELRARREADPNQARVYPAVQPSREEEAAPSEDTLG